MRAAFLCLLLAILAGTVFAQDTPAATPAEIDARTEAISKTLRCVVCQNQSIHDSNAPLAADMRSLVEKRVLAGDSDDEVRDYLRERYGDYVLMSPPFQINTLLLWLGPGLLLLIGFIWFAYRLRSRPEYRATELSEADRVRVATALAAKDDEATS